MHKLLRRRQEHGLDNLLRLCQIYQKERDDALALAADLREMCNALREENKNLKRQPLSLDALASLGIIEASSFKGNQNDR